MKNIRTGSLLVGIIVCCGNGLWARQEEEFSREIVENFEGKKVPIARNATIRGSKKLVEYYLDELAFAVLDSIPYFLKARLDVLQKWRQDTSARRNIYLNIFKKQVKLLLKKVSLLVDKNRIDLEYDNNIFISSILNFLLNYNCDRLVSFFNKDCQKINLSYEFIAFLRTELEEFVKQINEQRSILIKNIRGDGIVDILQFERETGFSGIEQYVRDCIACYKSINIDDLALKEKPVQPETKKSLLKEPQPEVPAPAASSNSQKNDVAQEPDNKIGGIFIRQNNKTMSNNTTKPHSMTTSKTNQAKKDDQGLKDLTWLDKKVSELEEKMRKMKDEK